MYCSPVADSIPSVSRRCSFFLSVRVCVQDMLCEMSVQVTTLAHLVHIWTCYGLSFSLIDLFLFLHVRQLLVGVWRNLVAMRNYSRALWELNARFPDASPDELQRQQDDVCSICRDSMEQAKKLPCGHLFHRVSAQSAPLIGRCDSLLSRACSPDVHWPVVALFFVFFFPDLLAAMD